MRCTVGSKPLSLWTTTSPDLRKPWLLLPRAWLRLSQFATSASIPPKICGVISNRCLCGAMVADRLKNHTPAGTFPQCVGRPDPVQSGSCLLLTFRDTGRPRRLSALALMLGTGSGSCTAGKIPALLSCNSSGLLVPGLQKVFLFLFKQSAEGMNSLV